MKCGERIKTGTGTGSITISAKINNLIKLRNLKMFTEFESTTTLGFFPSDFNIKILL